EESVWLGTTAGATHCRAAGARQTRSGLGSELSAQERNCQGRFHARTAGDSPLVKICAAAPAHARATAEAGQGREHQPDGELLPGDQDREPERWRGHHQPAPPPWNEGAIEAAVRLA